MGGLKSLRGGLGRVVHRRLLTLVRGVRKQEAVEGGGRRQGACGTCT